MDLTPLRRATPADHDAVVALVNAAYEKYIPRIGAEPGPMRSDYRALIANDVVYLLEQASTLLGILVVYPEQDHILLENIALAPAAQGKGYGKQLMAWVERLTRAEGLDEIQLYTHVTMTENIAIYKHLGYVETARRTEHGFTRVFMHKQLARP